MERMRPGETETSAGKRGEERERYGGEERRERRESPARLTRDVSCGEREHREETRRGGMGERFLFFFFFDGREKWGRRVNCPYILT